MLYQRLKLVLASATAFITLSVSAAQAFETQAQAAWVYDVTTHTVLLEKNAQEALPPASMSKLMTINMLFEGLDSGGIAMDTTFGVSEKAWKMGGSKMFVKPDDRPTVEELLHGIIINSGNDACVVVAEGLAGSEEAFSRLMTDRARTLGMNNSYFANASGWPDPGQRMTMEDLGILAVRLIEEFPEYYPLFALTEFSYKGRVPANSQNRNPLLRIKGGDWLADGLKTGHTQEAGFGLVGSAVKSDGRRVVFVISGLQSDAARAQEAEAIVNWAFREFAEKTVVEKDVSIAQAEVFMGDASSVSLVAKDELRLLLPVMQQGNVTAEVTYQSPLIAPLAAGQEVATLVIKVPGLPDRSLQLVTAHAVAKAGFTGRISTAAATLWKKYIMGETQAQANGATPSAS